MAELDKYFIIGYGLGGGFGGINNYEVVKVTSEDKAYQFAYEKAREEYESYDGMHGLETIDDIKRDNPEYSNEDAECEWVEQMESWIDYVVYPYTKGKEKELLAYHFENIYKEELHGKVGNR